jgi:hypothetical protein
MKKTIIFVQSYKFLDFHYKQYEIDSLKSFFKVECHDLTLIKNKNIEFYYKYLKNKYDVKKFVSFTNWKKKIFKEVYKHQNNLIICFLHFPSTFRELYIYCKLTKTKANVCVFNFDAMIKINPNQGLKIHEILSYKLKKFLSRPKQVINHIKISLINFIIKKISNYFFPKYIFLNSKDSYHEYKKKYKNSKVLRLHSWDGSKFINYKRKKNNKEKKTATYLSAFSIKSASDSAHYNTSRLENSEKILKSVNNFLYCLEKEFNYNINIAMHPREEENLNSPLHNEGKRFASKYLTNELVSESSLVITTMSTAISYAVLYKKPILFIITNEHFKNISLIKYVQGISKYLKSALINIDQIKKIEMKSELKKYTLSKYQVFKRDYLVNEKFKKTSNSQLMIKLFN